jgi:hypothetical protein
MSSSDAAPETSETKTIGTTRSFREERKILPPSSMMPSTKMVFTQPSRPVMLITLPKMIPAAIPRRILVVSDMILALF